MDFAMTYYFSVMILVTLLNFFTAIIMTYILYSDYSRIIPLLASSKEKEKRLNATMTIFAVYHAVSSAINAVNSLLYVLGPDFGLSIVPKTAGSKLWYGIIFEFCRNLYMFLPQIVVSFVTLDRLLVLVLHMHYTERRRRIVVYSDLISLVLMALVVAHYQYYANLDSLLTSIGVTFLRFGRNWQDRFIVLLVLKAMIGGLNTFNCFTFLFQLRKLPKLKVVS
ncbi:hypothetical protein DdX_12320 [Ditylenchus destructor]|uniref:Uncharacterized protein n=1 Tax=Ditylenchus destructor TaxID=166010 RepID=A0AAD4MVI4_9BILA|nr:hypothetical protein DdX_12320 [Ditylenchus destructor]